jgi:hypothetical protein
VQYLNAGPAGQMPFQVYMMTYDHMKYAYIRVYDETESPRLIKDTIYRCIYI